MGEAQLKDVGRDLAAPTPTGQIIHTDTVSLMEVLSRAAADPNTDVDKFERLAALMERMSDRQAAQLFDEAMNLAQGDMGPIRADANNPQTKSKYASYVALDRALRPIYTAHGFSLSFDTADGAPTDYVRVVCHVSHKAGDKRHPHIDMPADGKGAKGGDVMTKTHAIGAAMTYGQRYLLKLIFNIAVGEDDDGNSGPNVRGQTGAVSTAIEMINECAADADLTAWKAKNERVIAALSQPEQSAIIGAYNDRRSRMREAAQ